VIVVVDVIVTVIMVVVVTMAVLVPVVVAVAILIIVGVLVYMLVGVALGVSVAVRGLVDVQLEQGCRERPFEHLPGAQAVKLGQVEEAELRRKGLDGKPRVQQRAQEHIPTDAGETVAIENGHAMTPSFMLPIR
jgi:hypothetical protein